MPQSPEGRPSQERQPWKLMLSCHLPYRHPGSSVVFLVAGIFRAVAEFDTSKLESKISPVERTFQRLSW